MCRSLHGKRHHPSSVHVALLVVCLIAFTGCRKKRVSPPTPAPITAPAVETGIASWYGHPYHGRRTASGEVYDMEKMTAAHRTRPFNSWVRVYDLDNGRTVDVRINDRGPFVDGRIIDLSHAAARQIEMIGPGTAKVQVRTIAPPAMAVAPAPQPAGAPSERIVESTGKFAVQVGAFLDVDNAGRMRTELAKLFGNVRVIERDGDPPMWRVVVGEFSERDSAEAMAERIRGLYGPSFVVRLDAQFPPSDNGKGKVDLPDTPEKP